MAVPMREVINIGVGNPDLPPSATTIDALNHAAAHPENHGYQPYKGIKALRNAFSAWYQKAYGVHLNPDQEILPLMGSKEGIMHICDFSTGVDISNDRVKITAQRGNPTASDAVEPFVILERIDVAL